MEKIRTSEIAERGIHEQKEKDRHPRPLPKGLVLKSSEEIAISLDDYLDTLPLDDRGKLLLDQVEIYEKFLTDLGIGIDPTKPENDPFFQETGYSLRQIYEEKVKMIPKESESSQVSKNPVLPFGTLLMSFPRDAKPSYTAAGATETHFNVGECSVNTFQDKIINKRGWRFGFGFLRKRDVHGVELSPGTFCIEAQVAEALKNINHGEDIVKELEDILDYMNHDATVHATFFPFIQFYNDDVKTLPFSDRGSAMTNTFNENVPLPNTTSEIVNDGTTLMGEILSLVWHRSLSGKIASTNPAIVRLFGFKARKFLTSVKASRAELKSNENLLNKDESWAEDVCDYLISIYAYAFFRTIDEEQIPAVSLEKLRQLSSNFVQHPDEKALFEIGKNPTKDLSSLKDGLDELSRTLEIKKEFNLYTEYLLGETEISSNRIVEIQRKLYEMSSFLFSDTIATFLMRRFASHKIPWRQWRIAVEDFEDDIKSLILLRSPAPLSELIIKEPELEKTFKAIEGKALEEKTD